MPNLAELEKELNYFFKNRNFLLEALTHKSYKKPYNNERLEFLGDAVLDLVIGEYLFFKFPTANEGELSKIRASLVNEEGFARLAKKIELGKFIFISQGEENNGGREKSSLLSNAFEALMGAIYLESGLNAVKKATLMLLEKTYPKIDLQTLFKDYKTALQEYTQAVYGITPTYTLINSYGPDHNKEFEVGVSIFEKTISKAKGKSKKQAQQIAAKKALEILRERKKNE